MWTDNQRPGVYSRYDVASAYAAPRSARFAAVAARAGGGECGRVVEIGSAAALDEAFPPDTAGQSLYGCVQVLLQSGVSRVYAVAVGEDGYAPALALLQELDNLGAVVCDAGDEEDLAALRDTVEASSAAQRERVGFCGAADPGEALAAAGALNSERVVLCCPAAAAGGGNRSAAYSAAAMAGRVLAANDPVWNFNGGAMSGVREPDPLRESEVQALLGAGVTVLEQGAGGVECVRALTTRTRTGSVADHTLRGLNTVLCIDDVMGAVRAALQAALRGGRLGGGSLDAVRAQAMVALADRVDAGVIESFDAPRVSAHGADPTVCVVELGFAVAHVLHQIHVTAQIQV